MTLSTLVTSQLHFEMCAGLYGHPVYTSLLYDVFNWVTPGQSTASCL